MRQYRYRGMSVILIDETCRERCVNILNWPLSSFQILEIPGKEFIKKDQCDNFGHREVEKIGERKLEKERERGEWIIMSVKKGSVYNVI